MKLSAMSMLRIKKFYRIEFLIPFCNEKLYFSFFSFCLDKMFMIKKQQMTPPTIQGSQFGKTCWNKFLTLFCNQTLYFLFFSLWLHKMVAGPKEQFKLHVIWMQWIEKLCSRILSPRDDLKQYSKLSAFVLGHYLLPNNINSITFVLFVDSVPFIFD